MSEQKEFRFTPGARFTCNSCGKCCSSGFEIPLQDGKVSLIKNGPSYQTLVKQGYEPLRVLADKFYFMGSNEDGQCHFLEGNLCALHKNEGLSHKPVICQIYPYNLVQTPDGVQVSLLYSCPSVVTGDGALTTEKRDDLVQLFETHQGRIPRLGPIQNHILVTQEATITWKQYLALEKRLEHQLDESDPIRFLLNAALELSTNEPSLAKFDRTPGPLDPVIADPFQEFVSSVWAYLQDSETEELITLHKPSSTLVKETIVRYLLNEIHGKLLIIGPSLVARLVLTACGVAILLHQLQLYQEPICLEHLQHSFAFVEERLVSQTDDLQSALLEFEDFLLDMS